MTDISHRTFARMTYWTELASATVFEMRHALYRAVPPIDPPACFWLHSDAGQSYCRDCAVKARAEEFGLGMPFDQSVRRPWLTDLEDAFFDGIDGDYDTTSDISEFCSTCECTLSHILTDYGVQLEIEHFLQYPASILDAETVYALDRMSLNIGCHSDRQDLIGAFAILKQAVRLIGKRVAA